MGLAVAFLTVLPARPRDGDRALDWFPLVGLALGLGIGSWWWLTARVVPLAVAAALVVAADLALTGMLHWDGLLDSADGLLPHMERERRLAVMDAPDTGAFAVGVGATVLLLRWSALSSLTPSPLLIGGLWCFSRSAMALAVHTRDHARPDGGLAMTLGGGEPLWSVAGMSAGLLLLTLAAGVSGPLIALGAAAGAIAVIDLGRRRVGGYTGDVLGAAGVVAETIGLVVASGALA